MSKTPKSDRQRELREQRVRNQTIRAKAAKPSRPPVKIKVRGRGR